MAIAQPRSVKRFLWHFRAYRVIFGLVFLTLVSLIFLWIDATWRTLLLSPDVEYDTEKALN